jgi:hypothetical protein
VHIGKEALQIMVTQKFTPFGPVHPRIIVKVRRGIYVQTNTVKNITMATQCQMVELEQHHGDTILVECMVVTDHVSRRAHSWMSDNLMPKTCCGSNSRVCAELGKGTRKGRTGREGKGSVLCPCQ